MMPITIPVGSGNIIVTNLFIVVSWLVFSFLLWRGLRHEAVEEDRIFDLTFYATLVAFITARAGFVVAHSDLFWGKSLLLIAAIWVEPGLSWFVGLVGGAATLVLLSRRYKVRLGLVLDALAMALPLPILLGEAGFLLSLAERGKPAVLPWSIRIGDAAEVLRHPVQLYEMIAIFFISLVILRLSKTSVKQKWPYGLVGLWFFLLYAMSGFVLELFKDSRVYWGGLTANQWILIGVFAESIGVLYVRGGGREHLRPTVYKTFKYLEEKGKYIHESVSRKYAR